MILHDANLGEEAPGPSPCTPKALVLSLVLLGCSQAVLSIQLLMGFD